MRQPHPRARAADDRAPHGSRGARPKAATPAQPTGGGAPAPRWSPPVTTGAAERRPREGREGGSETAVHGSPRVDGGDGNGDRSGGRRRRGSGRRGRRRSGGRRPKRRGGRGRRGRGEPEEGDAETGEGPGRRRRRTGARRRRRRERATARARFRRGERATSGGNGGGRHGERLYRVGRGRERPDEGETAAEDPAAIDAPARLGEEFPNESEGEREGKMGGKREGITGNISPLLIARGTDGSGGIRGGGGARARARRRERREVGDDGWAPPVSEGGGRARPSAARARGEAEWAAGRGGRGEGDGPSRPKRGKGGKRTF
ncbi:splicing coactivator subunit-like protein [Oryza sativa Japonica Group]|uniref:Splicing coactivator subunit-like protein n=1 Tax=Oryza sativa subsp. japonica TaxID=39947 RepID=Q5ZD27_ORYSJ|nr:splicing coactivator subunit-like protein [Oryza sativa Japonica Group]